MIKVINYKNKKYYRSNLRSRISLKNSVKTYIIFIFYFII